MLMHGSSYGKGEVMKGMKVDTPIIPMNRSITTSSGHTWDSKELQQRRWRELGLVERINGMDC
jgi:hypothetical protein